MAIRPFLQYMPKFADDCWLDEMSVIIGDVVMNEQCSAWPFAVIRGDVNSIRIGARTNIQDGAILHVSRKNDAKPNGSPLHIGDEVTIGHQAMLHGCTIGNRVLIGMGTTILDDVVVEDDVIIAAHTLVPPRKHLASGFMYMGSPAVAVRALTAREIASIRENALHYVNVSNQYRQTHDNH